MMSPSYIHVRVTDELCIISSYDGSNFVREVVANYIMWEERQQGDYSYNATMAQVRFQPKLYITNPLSEKFPYPDFS